MVDPSICIETTFIFQQYILDILFRQITTFIKVSLAFIFELQTLKLFY